MLSTIDRYRTKAVQAKSREEFATDVNEMISQFGDSHFEFSIPTEQVYFLMDSIMKDGGDPMPEVGLWFAPKEETVGSFRGTRILMVMDGSEAYRQGLRKNDLVLSADGKPLQPVESFVGHKKIQLKVAEPSAGSFKIQSISLPVENRNCEAMFLDAMKRSERVIQAGDFDIGYVRVWTMLTDQFADELGNALDGPIGSCDGLIVDFRDGIGGNPENFTEMLGAESTPYAFGNKSASSFSGPTVILINGGTRSAKELAAAALRRSKQAVLIGERTKGAVLAASALRVNKWSILEIPVENDYQGAGRLEGVGVAPDINAPDTYEGGDDKILDKALLHLQNQLRKRKKAS